MVEKLQQTKFKIRYKLLFFIIAIHMLGCIEPFEAETESFESILVVEASLTDEVKFHEIELKRTYRFEENEASSETNAMVKIVDDLQKEYIFQQNSEGKYVSLSHLERNLNGRINY